MNAASVGACLQVLACGMRIAGAASWPGLEIRDASSIRHHKQSRCLRQEAGKQCKACGQAEGLRRRGAGGGRVLLRRGVVRGEFWAANLLSGDIWGGERRPACSWKAAQPFTRAKLYSNVAAS